MEIGIYIVLIIFQIALISKVVKFNFISPIYIYIIFYSLCISLTVAYYYFYEDKISLYNFDFISNRLFLEAISFHGLALCAFCLGVLLYYDFAKPKVRKLFSSSFDSALKFQYSLPESLKMMTHIFMCLIILLCAFSYGEMLFLREEYLIEKNTSFITLMKLLSFVTVLMLGVSYKNQKWISVFYFALIMLIATGTGSRLAVVYLLVFSLLIFISGNKSGLSKFYLGVNFVFSFVYLAFLMSVRSLSTHGLIPYVESVFTDSTDITSRLVFNVYYTFIFGIFVTSKTLVGDATTWNTILISVNPLPGKWVGWYDVANTLRANRFAPYSANGEVFSMGKIFTGVFFTLIGIAFSFMESKMRFLFKTGNKVFGFIIAILCILFVVYSFEYNLRSTMRYLYYALFVLLIYQILGRYVYKMRFVKVPKSTKSDS